MNSGHFHKLSSHCIPVQKSYTQAKYCWENLRHLLSKRMTFCWLFGDFWFSIKRIKSLCRFFCDCGAGTTSSSCRLTNKQPVSSPAKARSSRSPKTQRTRQKRTSGRCLRNGRNKEPQSLSENISETLVR